MSVDYKVLVKYLKEDVIDLNYHKMCQSLENIEMDESIEILFRYYRKHGFPHYKIRDEEKHEQMRKLQNFKHEHIIDGNEVTQTMNGLRLAWSYFPQFWDVPCGNAKTTPMQNFNDDPIDVVSAPGWRTVCRPLHAGAPAAGGARRGKPARRADRRRRAGGGRGVGRSRHTARRPSARLWRTRTV